MNRIKNTLVSLLLAVSMVVISMYVITPDRANAETVVNHCVSHFGTNKDLQDYYSYGRPVTSALITTADGKLMLFQYCSDENSYFAQYFDKDLNFISEADIPGELPLYGGFYYDGKNYYILTGQTNSAESNAVEVYRVTKYDSNWKRLGSASLYGENTVYPFDAGSARMDHDGNLLFIRTCHKMYTSDDGLNHQANVTIEINTDTMTVVDKYTVVMNVNYGYVSHSFNQFIKLDGGYIVAVDHGDANPRSIVLTKYRNQYTSTGFSKYTNYVHALPVGGGYGNNYTGASVGGFEISSSNYIFAGNTIDQNNFAESKTRNIFVSVTSRSNIASSKVKMITSYPEGSESASTPHMVKLGENSFMLIWLKDEKVNYCLIDGNGVRTSEFYEGKADLSDCVPCLVDGKVVWYVWKNSKITFYSIDTARLGNIEENTMSFGHQFIYTEPAAGSNVASRTCSFCHLTESVTTYSRFNAWFAQMGFGDSYYGHDYYSTNKYTLKCNRTVQFWLEGFTPADAQDKEFEIISSNENIARAYVDPNTGGSMGYLKYGTEEGTANIYFKVLHNQKISKTLTVTVSHNFSKTGERPASGTTPRATIYTCADCGTVKYVEEITPTFVGVSASLTKNIEVSMLFRDIPSDGYVVISGPSGTYERAVSTMTTTTGSEYELDFELYPKYMRDSYEIYVLDSTKKNRVNLATASGANTSVGFSFYSYLETIKKNYSTNAEIIATVDALENYCDNAAKYLGYSGVSGASYDRKDGIEAFDKNITGVLPSGLTYSGSSLVLEDCINIRHYFSGDISGCTFTAGGVSLAPKKVSEGLYYVEIPGVYVSKFGDNIPLNISGRGASWTLDYSVLTYCYDVEKNAGRTDDKSVDTELVNLCRNIYQYYFAVMRYSEKRTTSK